MVVKVLGLDYSKWCLCAATRATETSGATVRTRAAPRRAAVNAVTVSAEVDSVR